MKLQTNYSKDELVLSRQNVSKVGSRFQNDPYQIANKKIENQTIGPATKRILAGWKSGKADNPFHSLSVSKDAAAGRLSEHRAKTGFGMMNDGL